MSNQSARRNGAAVANRAQCLGQRSPADAVHDTGPQLGAQGPAVVVGEFAPDDAGGPELPQVVVFRCLA
jgi:hypothetical protein